MLENEISYDEKDIIRKNHMQLLPCPLSNDELLDKSREMVKLKRRLEKLTAEEKSRQATENARLKEIKDQILARENIIESGCEERTVPCDEVFQKPNLVVGVRKDTNKVVYRRTASLTETQTHIPGATSGGLMDQAQTRMALDDNDQPDTDVATDEVDLDDDGDDETEENEAMGDESVEILPPTKKGSKRRG